jgi:hypothetical protein
MRDKHIHTIVQLLILFFSNTLPAQTRVWFKTEGFDSLLQIAYYVDFYERDEGFNGTYWTEGSRVRFDFLHGRRF